MRKHETWQFAGSAPETYQRALVPAIFAPWVSQVVDLANPDKAIAYWMWRAGPASWLAPRPAALAPPVRSPELISIQEC